MTTSHGGTAPQISFFDGHRVAWIVVSGVGGFVCGEPTPGAPDGICGMPVESEPCNIHHPPVQPEVPWHERLLNWVKWRTVWRHHWAAPRWWQMWR